MKYVYATIDVPRQPSSAPVISKRNEDDVRDAKIGGQVVFLNPETILDEHVKSNLSRIKHLEEGCNVLFFQELICDRMNIHITNKPIDTHTHCYGLLVV